MSDPIDEGLTALEQHAPGFLQGAVHTLREGWEFVVDDYFPDPNVLHTQGNNLSSLHERGKALYDQYNQSLLTLRDLWQGGLADSYLPPSATAFQVEHDMEPTDSSASTPLELYFRDFVDSLDHNSATHHTWAGKFDDTRGKQAQARFTIGGAVVSSAAMLALPVLGEAADGGILAAAAGTVGAILNTVRQMWQDYKIIIIIVGVAGVATATAVTIEELVKPGQTTTTTGNATGTGAITLDFSKLQAKCANPADYAAIKTWMECNLSADEIKAILSKLDELSFLPPPGSGEPYGGLMYMLYNAATGAARNATGSIRVIDFLVRMNEMPDFQSQWGPVSIANVVTVRYPTIIPNPSGNGYQTVGDFDVIMQTPKGLVSIEVGGPAKGANPNFGQQLLTDQQMARAYMGGANVQQLCVLADPGPGDPSGQALVASALATAKATLGPDKAFILPYNPNSCAA